VRDPLPNDILQCIRYVQKNYSQGARRVTEKRNTRKCNGIWLPVNKCSRAY
jgi:hypothetical protein